MMPDFQIDVQAGVGAAWDSPHPIELRAGEISFTKLLRHESNAADGYLQAPPIPLAFWLIDNWWRIRWEPVGRREERANWRLAHDLSAIGGGYVWPRLWMWGEDARVGLSARSDPSGVLGPVRYITDALVFVRSDLFEKEVFRFLHQAVQAQTEDRVALRAQFDALQEERADESVTAWRRLEAKLGFDPDDAPEGLLESLIEYTEAYGCSGVEEAAVADPGTQAVETLREEIAAAKQSRLICDLSDAVAAAGTVERGPDTLPWQAAEAVAKRIRDAIGVGEAAPLRNARLGELFKVSKEVFRTRETAAASLNYGLRLRNVSGDTNLVALKAKWSHDRRFELSRALGDAILSQCDALGPITRAKTGRQKFQRAFAQSLLCPYQGLRAFFDTEEPTEADVSAAARHFHVAERVIQSILVNKGVIGRHQFDEMVEAA